MTSVITGDIINSGQFKSPEVWLVPLKESLIKTGVDRKYWEIYRGDSFQIEVRNIQESFIISLYLKACIKVIKNLDVRIAIGVGNKTFEGKTIAESNGEAFQFSGNTLENLKKEKANLMIKSKYSDFDKEMNLYFKLASIAMDNWTPNSAEVAKLSYEYPKSTQEELAKLINISQDAVSKRAKRAHLDKLFELDLMFRLKLEKLIS
ncbi:transcriptional regulator [Winogradskyella flava]|uniref:Transcriptional regulator n=1 Tax=Winogradskyella flava TaxID=1884876 RepID=A0A842IUR8_9FLAO|nr:transcriptional regulator [Winogradskyella flava]MBC2845879.1 transcriptional regulator [Winogradskyella flava]